MFITCGFCHIFGFRYLDDLIFERCSRYDIILLPLGLTMDNKSWRVHVFAKGFYLRLFANSGSCQLKIGTAYFCFSWGFYEIDARFFGINYEVWLLSGNAVLKNCILILVSAKVIPVSRAPAWKKCIDDVACNCLICASWCVCCCFQGVRLFLNANWRQSMEIFLW